MTERELQALMKTVSEMAARIGAVFIPDPEKLKVYRKKT